MKFGKIPSTNERKGVSAAAALERPGLVQSISESLYFL